MAQRNDLSDLKNLKQYKSLIDLGFFGSSQTAEVTTMLESLGISKYRPLILADSSVVLRLNDAVVLLALRAGRLGGPTYVICGWKEKNTDGKENYCLGIMDEQVTIAGEYYRCRKHPGVHRTLK